MDAIIIIFVFVFAACVGSFLNVVIYRMPRGESIVSPPSRCPGCGGGIAWYDNIPILSWLALRGKCRHCGVRISPQYIAIETAAGLLAVGLYVCYFTLNVRRLGLGPEDAVGAEALKFARAWPMFIAHAGLLFALLACAAVDIKYYIVPLPVMWTVAVVGAAAAAFRPHPFLASASATHVAMSLAAVAGLAAALVAIAKGWLKRSFADAPDWNGPGDELASPAPKKAAAKNKRAKHSAKRKRKKRGSVGATAEAGVHSRVEVLRELLFLAPAFVLALAAWAVLTHVPAAGRWWGQWFDAAAHPSLAPRLTGVGGSLFGFLMGGLWIWGTRILATLALGREAMGMGDVHILAGVGAVTGWVVPALAFFAAPVSGIVVVLYLFITRRQRELPYGPWLALGTVLVMIFYDRLVEYFGPGLTALRSAFG